MIILRIYLYLYLGKVLIYYTKLYKLKQKRGKTWNLFTLGARVHPRAQVISRLGPADTSKVKVKQLRGVVMISLLWQPRPLIMGS